MTAFDVQTTAQFAIERMLNSLPEGLLIALFAWAILRILPRQNARSRFAVWFFALVAIAALPFLGGLAAWSRFEAYRFLPGGAVSAISLPAHWAPLVFGVWLLMAAVPLSRLAVGVFRLHQLRRNCVPVDRSAFDPSVRETITQLNSTKSFWARPVTFATSDEVRVPAALGLWKPMIVLPDWALRELAPSELVIVLHHEFAHVRRWDDWTNLIQKIVRAVFFFHPAVWWVENRLSVEREMACDDVVVAETDNPTGYASCLVSLLERSLAQRGWTMAQAIVHRAREASVRLVQILDRNRPVTTHLSKPGLGLLGVFTVLCLAAAPSAPEFVAFDRGPSSSTNTLAVARDESPIVPATMIHQAVIHSIDAATHATFDEKATAPAAKKRAGVRSTSVQHDSTPMGQNDNLVARDFSPSDVETASADYGSVPDALMQMVALSQADFAPGTRTLVFAEATRVGPSTFLWQVQVWRLPVSNMKLWRMTVIAPLWQKPVRGPVANSI